MVMIGIIGATGLVGKAILDSFETLKLHHIASNLSLYASKSSKGQQLMCFNKEYEVKEFTFEILEILDYALLAVESDLSKEVWNYVKENDLPVKIIDSSSAFRLKRSVPLVVPEINPQSITKESQLIANPNCSTTFLCMLLKPLESVGSINMVVTSTYQASSGAGIKGMNELMTQTRQYVGHDELTTDFWNRQYIFNVFPHNSKYDPTTMHNEEELKMINETNKILDKKYEIISTCVRVPTIRSHCLSVNVFFDKEVEYDQIVKSIKSFKGVTFTDDPSYPDAVMTNNKTDVFIGRVRPGINNKKIWNFFISGDQLLKGAGYNTVQILDLMLKF